MKKLLSIILILSCGSNIVISQDSWMSTDFQKFRDSLYDNYNGFRDSINNEYVQFLSTAWKEYTLNKGKIREDQKPKPMEPIKYELPKIGISTSKPENLNTQLPLFPIIKPAEEELGELISPPLDSAQHDKILSIKDNIINLIPQAGVPISFFGHTLYVDYPDAKRIRLKYIDEKTIASTWKRFLESDYYPVLRSTIGVIRENNLNDWAVYLLTAKICSQIPGFENHNIRTLFNHFLLVQIGYDARIARIGTDLVVLLPIKDEVYSTPYLQLNKNINYYIFAPHCNYDKKAYIYTCDIPKMSITGSCLSLDFNKEIKLPEKRLATIRNSNNLKFNGYVNENLIDFYKAYPECDFKIMARTNPSSSLKKQLIRDITEAIKGKSSKDALTIVLNWVQKGFDYKTDDDQFGVEKPFFIDEAFYYPYCDCEDRSFLFTYIVKNILGYDAVLLDYPGHVATAVKMDSLSGDFILIDGNKYIVCDPTYIGAGPGRSMPAYKDQKAKLIMVKNTR